MRYKATPAGSIWELLSSSVTKRQTRQVPLLFPLLLALNIGMMPGAAAAASRRIKAQRTIGVLGLTPLNC